MTPEDRYAELAETFAADPAVTLPGPGSSFGSSALKVHGKIFAMLMDDHLVVKVPRARVEQLLSSGEGVPFRSGGRVMKEWVTLTSQDQWAPLTFEARAFVGGGGAR
jgi:hypothetical protein